MINPHLLGVGGPECRVTARAAAWLIDHLRGAPPAPEAEVADTLRALGTLAAWDRQRVASASRGSSVDPKAEAATPLTRDILTTGQAAQAAGITARAVRLACEQQRLTAERDTNGQWRIRRSDLERWRAA